MTDTYLQDLAFKIQRYNDAKDVTVKYLINNKVKDRQMIENCVIMSQIWAAHQLGEMLTMTDLNIFLGGEDDELIDYRELSLDKQFEGSTLIEMLDVLTTNDKLKN